jgi:hypothetical protein
MLQLHAFSEGNLLVIDGDALPYMLGWHHRDSRDIPRMHRAIDSWFQDFFLLSAADAYVGILSPGTKCFRYEVYKYKPYKGNRPPKEEWMSFWEPHIRAYLQTQYGFVKAPDHLETDDVVAALGIGLPHMLKSMGSDKFPYICSPDKDLKQIPGYHLDYRKVGENEAIKSELVSVEQASYNWCMQMLCGDSTDNIAGVPKIGEKKAAELLKSVEPFRWKAAVKVKYLEYFSDYYGEIIYNQTCAAVTMMTPTHPLWPQYEFDRDYYLQNLRKANKYASQPLYS